MEQKSTSLRNLLIIAGLITLVFFCINLVFGSITFASAGIYNAWIQRTPNHDELQMAGTQVFPTEPEAIALITDEPTQTATFEPTNTQFVPTETNAPVVEDTEEPGVPTSTEAPPTETALPSPTATITQTSTPRSTNTPAQTSTNRPTRTQEPTETLEPTITLTPAPTQAPPTAIPTLDPTAEAEPFAAYIQENLYDSASLLPPYSVILSTDEGKYHALEDYDNNWNLTDSYPIFTPGYDYDNFVIRADANWQVYGNPSMAVNSGCGIIFHQNEEEDHYMVVFSIGDRAILYRKMDGALSNLGASYRYDVDPENAQAEVMIAVEDNHIHIFVDGEEVYNKKQPYLESGELAFTVFSEVSRDFGTHCRLSNIELWEIDKE